MKEIKSVRVRKKFSSGVENQGVGDYKVTLFDNGRNKFKVSAGQIGKVFLFSDYRKEGSFENFSDDDFIKDGINILVSKQNDNKEFEIIQYPWLDTPPKWRSFGFDPYYLNNGSEVYIRWFIGNTVAGGREWSDDNGKELDIQKGSTQSTKLSITKNIRVISESENLEINKNGIISKYELNGKDYVGTQKDLDIINELISLWKVKVPNYESLRLCSPDNESCYSSSGDNILQGIKYISPVQALDSPTEPEDTNSVEKSQRIEMKVVIPNNLELRVKQDIPSLKIYFGEIPQENAEQDGFDFGDFNSDISLLGEEFIESEFGGDESVFEEQDYPDVQTRIETLNEAKLVNNEPYVPGKYTLDLIPGSFLDNSKNPIRCCQIDGKPVNIKIADSLLDMIAAAKKDGINLIVNSGFRPGYGSSINAKSEKGVKVTADSQEVLWNKNCAGKATCNPDTAKPGSSKHGSGLAIDFNTGTRTGAKRISKMDPTKAKNYEWLVKNSWRFGYLRTVPTEEWHFEYWPQLAKKGPYAKLAKTNELYYADLGINNLQVTTS
jgi:hypothetical protein